MAGKMEILVLLLVLSGGHSQGRPHRMDGPSDQEKKVPQKCCDNEGCSENPPLFTAKHLLTQANQEEGQIHDDRVDLADNLYLSENEEIDTCNSDSYGNCDSDNKYCLLDDEDCDNGAVIDDHDDDDGDDGAATAADDDDDDDDDDDGIDHHPSSENQNDNRIDQSEVSQPNNVKVIAHNKDNYIYF